MYNELQSASSPFYIGIKGLLAMNDKVLVGIQWVLRWLYILTLLTNAITLGVLYNTQGTFPTAWFLLFTISASCLLYSFSHSAKKHTYPMLLQFVILTILWGVMVDFAGGATSSANALQLILVTLIFLALPIRQALIAAAILFLFQCYYLYEIILVASYDESHLHFLGMSLVFMIAAIMIALVATNLKYIIARRQMQIAQLREDQLRQEQIVALATSSVQITHELATPLNTLTFWIDDLEESQSLPKDDIQQLQEPLRRMKELLYDLRETARAVRQETLKHYSIEEITHYLQTQIQLQFPLTRIHWDLSPPPEQATLYADYSLLPALLSLIRNAAQHHSNNNQAIDIQSQFQQGTWQLTITNHMTDISGETLEQLGKSVVESDQGLGIGTLLSHATLERFHGHLSVHYQSPLFIQQVELPISHQNSPYHE